MFFSLDTFTAVLIMQFTYLKPNQELRHAIYVQRNSMVVSRNHFAVQTKQCTLCVVGQLHVTVNYIKTLDVAQQ